MGGRKSMRKVHDHVKYGGFSPASRQRNATKILKSHLQTQLSGLVRLVITRTIPAALAMGMAQHTTRGVERPLDPIVRLRRD